MFSQGITFWSLLEQYSIEIPIIQRDYVQGRKSEIRVRDGFLSAIYHALKEDKDLHLDFIYGVIKEDKFIPLDGQQRLTTLFLLHYYLGLREKQFDAFQALLLDENQLPKFSYEIRESSKEFCNLLVQHELSLDKPISDTIKDQNWFFSKWEQDPTIASMLVMLDTIQTVFREDNLFEKLKCKITFSFLEPEKLNIRNSDELYIKMNARGKQLNEFENFKSSFVAFLDEESQVKFDNSWFDIFWNLHKANLQKLNISEREKLIEEKVFGAYLNFFKNLISLYDIDNASVDVFKFDYTINQVEEIKKVLDALCNYQDSMVYKLRDYSTFKINPFQDFLKSPDKLTYSEKARFYALMQFFIKVGSVQNNKKLFRQWIRVTLNFINNQIIDEVKGFKNALSGLNALSDNIQNLYNHVDSKPININYFSPNQRKEESLKASLILKNPAWENKLIEAESHWYLNGQIGFLLDFAKNDLNKFIEYKEKFFTLFDKNKIDKDKEYQTLIHRTLLTFGDYLPHHGKGTQCTFCSYGTDLREKNENWRQVFKQQVFKKLLDDKRDLKTIVNDFSFDCDDWKSYFINPNEAWEVISYAKHFQLDKNNNQTYLNRGNVGVTRWSWRRVAELYSYYLFKESFQEKVFGSFSDVWYWNSSSANEDKPCIVIRGFERYEIKISFQEDKFHIHFYDRDKTELPQNIIEVLEQSGFQTEDYWYTKTVSLCNRQDVFIEIQNLCKELEQVEV